MHNYPKNKADQLQFALAYSSHKCTCIFSKQMHLHILQTPNKCTCILSKQVRLHIFQMFLTTAKTTLQLSRSIIQNVKCIHPVRVWRSEEKLSRWACLYSPVTTQVHVPVQLYLGAWHTLLKKERDKKKKKKKKKFFPKQQQKATTSTTIVFKAFEIWQQSWLLLCYHFAWIQVG